MRNGQLTSAVGTKSGGTIPRDNGHFGHPYDPAGNLRVQTNNTWLQTFTTDNADALVNIMRNNNGLTVMDEGCKSSFASPTHNGFGTVSKYDNIKNRPEWPLVKPLIIAGTAFPIVAAVGDFHEAMARLIEQRIRFGPVFDGARLRAVGAATDPITRQVEQ
jgi:hypothetical protein